MDTLRTTFSRLRFPGRAGEHQRAGASASLVRETGDNYETYHSFLAARLEGAGARPRPGDYGSIDEYLAAWALVEEIVEAEAFIRRARAFREGRGRLDAPQDTSVPLVDASDRLVSATDPKRNERGSRGL